MKASFCNLLVGRALLIAFVFTAGPLLAADPGDWGKELPAKHRFVVLSDFGDRAILDKETQLVWERFPADLDGNGVVSSADRVSFLEAAFVCVDRSLGGRKGWRLPAVNELSSLVDPTRQSAPFLPDGNPFVFCLEGALVSGCPPSPDSLAFWTNTIIDHDPVGKWTVDFNTGDVRLGGGLENTPALVWCVRGPTAGPESH